MGKPQSEYYISVDIEADGPCPGLNSMKQLGAAFYNAQGVFMGSLCLNLEPLPDAQPDPETMAWWAKQELEQPGIIARLEEDQRTPFDAMRTFAEQVEHYNKVLKGKPVVVCYPAGFDFTFIYWYLMRFNGKSCVGFSCIDLKTMSMALLNRGYRDHGKKDMPKHWFAAGLPHTHRAEDDAIEQAELFFAMREDLRKLHTMVPEEWMLLRWA